MFEKWCSTHHYIEFCRRKYQNSDNVTYELPVSCGIIDEFNFSIIRPIRFRIHFWNAKWRLLRCKLVFFDSFYTHYRLFQFSSESVKSMHCLLVWSIQSWQHWQLCHQQLFTPLTPFIRGGHDSKNIIRVLHKYLLCKYNFSEVQISRYNNVPTLSGLPT